MSSAQQKGRLESETEKLIAEKQKYDELHERLKLHELIANVGHDTEKVKAPDQVYLKLPDCCMYRDNDNTHHD
jgi:hypothetical protein